MPNSRRYLYLHKGDNEFLADDPPRNDNGLLKDWNDAWAKINKEADGMQVEITEAMYLNSDYGEMPEWIDVHIQDDLILQYKIARSVIKSLEGARHITFTSGFVADVSDDWGRLGHWSISISDTGAWVTLRAKPDVKVVITEQFNQAIGE